MVTRGAEGSLVYLRDGRRVEIPAVPAGQVLAHRIVLAVTVAAIATMVLRAAVAVLARDAEVLYLAASIAGLTWGVVVALGYFVKYRPLVWACRALGQDAP